MNTSFRTSEFDKQAAASLEYMDVDAAKERVQAILHPQAGPTLTPQSQTQPRGSKVTQTDSLLEGEESRPAPNRKPRSDKGIPKGPKAPADPDEIVLRLDLESAREIAKNLPPHNHFIATRVQDQIIAQLQRRLDQLQKAPK